jgi:hypothetical protein
MDPVYRVHRPGGKRIAFRPMDNMKKIKLLTFFTAAVSYFGGLANTAAAQQTLQGLEEAAKKGLGGGSKPEITSLPEAIGKIIGAGLAFLGVIFLVLIIYSGFVWMLSRGNDQAVSKAKDTISAAIIGLVIVLAAYALTNFIGQALIN